MQSPQANKTVSSFLDEAVKRLENAGCDSPRREARLLLAYSAAITPEKLLTVVEMPEREVLEKFENLLQRREKREPLAQILGSRPFWSLDFYVNSHTLSPRPDSETLVEAVLSLHEDVSLPVKILDLGTGSGCLLLALLSEFRNATGVGMDISAKALDVARQNAAALNMLERVSFVQGNWFETITGKFDIVISNPPYIESDEIASLMPEVREYEPRIALDGGEDGLSAYRQIFGGLNDRLHPKGLAFFEHGINQAEALATIAKQANLVEAGRYADLNGIQRVMALRKSSCVQEALSS